MKNIAIDIFASHLTPFKVSAFGSDYPYSAGHDPATHVLVSTYGNIYKEIGYSYFQINKLNNNKII